MSVPKKKVPSAPAAVVTGAGRGIGRAIVLALVREGFSVVGIDIAFEPGNTKKGLFEVKERVRELGGRFLPVAGDVSRIEDHDRMLDAAVGVCGRMLTKAASGIQNDEAFVALESERSFKEATRLLELAEGDA